MFAVMTVFLFGAMAFAIDLGRVYLVRNELQNAADLEALAVAGVLYPPPDPTSGIPNWSRAETVSTQAIKLNKSEGAQLTVSTVSLGYWNLQTRTGTWGKPATPPGVNEVPAVRVALARDTAGSNGGPVAMTFGRLLGEGSFPVGAVSIAVVSIPTSVGPGSIAPYAISSCVFSRYWDSAAAKPAVDPDTGKPFEIVLGNSSTCRDLGCNCGIWTTFTKSPASENNIKGFIDEPFKDNVSIGDSMIMASGMKADLFHQLGDKYAGQTIVLPVMNDDGKADPNCSPGGNCRVVAFACFRPDYTVKGTGPKKGGPCDVSPGTLPNGTVIPKLDNGIEDNKCVVGRFVAGECKIAGGTGGGGPYYGTYLPPRLAQ